MGLMILESSPEFIDARGGPQTVEIFVDEAAIFLGRGEVAMERNKATVERDFMVGEFSDNLSEGQRSRGFISVDGTSCNDYRAFL